jgi:hypothetical protein
LSLSPASITQVQGSRSLVHVLVTLVSGIPIAVNLSAQGVPAATEILFSPTSGISSFSSALTIATNAGTPLGQFNITIIATGGGLERSALVSLLLLGQTPGPQPVPSPAASGSAQGLTYGRQLAIVAAIAEAAMVFLVFLRGKSKGSTRNGSVGPRKI